jgi:DHA2 family multidrug resistance protein
LSADTTHPGTNPIINPPIINPWIIAMAVMLSTFMEVLDTTVVNVALPHIAGSVSATEDEATWALTSYLVANAIILPMAGWLAQYFGRKRLLLASTIGFTISSALCGFAPNLPLLILFRIMQGLCGGPLQPLSQAILLESFKPEDRGKAMGFWGLGIVVAPVLGPVLGGWLTDSYSWRWIFYINIPIGILSVIMAKLYIFDPAYMKRKAGGIDVWGIGMLALGIGALQILLDQGQQNDWFESHLIVWLAVLSVASLAAFIYRSLKIQNPIVNLRVFKERTYATGVFLMTVLGFVLYGSLVLLPVWLQTLMGYPALAAGIAMSPRGLGSMLGMPFVGMFIGRYDARKFLAAGLFIASLTLFRFSQLSANVGYWDLFWPQFVQGISLSLLFVPLTTITMNRISKENMGNATSLFNLLRNIGGSVGIAGVVTMFARRQQTFINTLGSHVTPYSPQTQAMSRGLKSAFQAGGSDPVTASHQAYAGLFGMVQRQAVMLSFLDVFQILSLMFLALIPLIFFMKRPGKAGAGEISMH